MTAKSTVHLGRKVGAILLRDVWTDTAEVLLQMVSYTGQFLFDLFSLDRKKYFVCLSVDITNDVDVGV